jgi:hypothetical protein
LVAGLVRRWSCGFVTSYRGPELIRDGVLNGMRLSNASRATGDWKASNPNLFLPCRSYERRGFIHDSHIHPCRYPLEGYQTLLLNVYPDVERRRARHSIRSHT